MADVFISYSKVDRAIAELLANDLKARGFEVWWDFELYAGDDFHDMIRAEIAKAKAVIVIWSDAAVASRWVRGEAEEASDLDTLISAHIPGFETRKVPINFRALHCEPVVNRDRLIGAIERKGAKRTTAARPPAPVDESTPLDVLIAKAAAGNAEAQSELGYRFVNGDGLPQSYEEAVRFWSLAADQGDTVSQYHLALMYANGSGVAKDEAKAARLYRLAAEQGFDPAQLNLGAMYADGRGVSKDEREAARLYRLAAEQGNANAQCNLGIAYEEGSGVAKDQEEAARLYRRASDLGHAGAQCNLGVMYEYGRGTPKDEVEASRLFRLAAEQGEATAQYNLGTMYANGRGVAKDDTEAVRLYRLAAAQGDDDAKKALARRGISL